MRGGMGYAGMGSHPRAGASSASDLGFSLPPDSNVARELGLYLLVSAPPPHSFFSTAAEKEMTHSLLARGPELLPERILEAALLLEMDGDPASAPKRHPHKELTQAQWAERAIDVREKIRAGLGSSFRIGEEKNNNKNKEEEEGEEETAARSSVHQYTTRWSVRADEELVALAAAQGRSWGVATATLDAAALNLSMEVRVHYPALSGEEEWAIRGRYALIRVFNQLGATLFQSPPRAAANVSTAWEDLAVLAAAGETVSTAALIEYLKPAVFPEIKVAMILRSLGPTSAPTYLRVNVNRAKARVVSRSKKARAADPDGLNSIFGQLFSQLRHLDYGALRGAKNENMFQIGFLGEGSMDGGGPYREALMLACAELMSDATPLFTPSPNGVHGVGINRDRFTVSVAASSELHLAMFEFLGAILGMGMRTNVNMPVAFVPLVWKRILRVPTTTADLEAVDRMLVQSLRETIKMEQDVFDEWLDEVFVTTLHDGTVVELLDGGADTRVTYDRRLEFARLVVRAHLDAIEDQVDALRRGLASVVPLHALSLCSGPDLEYLICGAPDVNVDTLKRHTLFNGSCRGTPTESYFWEVLEEFSPDERQLFLRFVWGRNRLPLRDSDWNQQFMITVDATKSRDGLPKASTCNFSIYLPEYSTKDVLATRLRFAIVNCQAIDTDYTPTDTQASLWVDYEDDDVEEAPPAADPVPAPAPVPVPVPDPVPGPVPSPAADPVSPPSTADRSDSEDDDDYEDDEDDEVAAAVAAAIAAAAARAAEEAEALALAEVVEAPAPAETGVEGIPEISTTFAGEEEEYGSYSFSPSTSMSPPPAGMTTTTTTTTTTTERLASPTSPFDYSSELSSGFSNLSQISDTELENAFRLPTDSSDSSSVEFTDPGYSSGDREGEGDDDDDDDDDDDALDSPSIKDQIDQFAKKHRL